MMIRFKRRMQLLLMQLKVIIQIAFLMRICLHCDTAPLASPNRWVGNTNLDHSRCLLPHTAEWRCSPWRIPSADGLHECGM